jgi:hypothetical protein
LHPVTQSSLRDGLFLENLPSLQGPTLPHYDHSVVVVVAIVVVATVMAIIRLCIRRDRKEGDDSQQH